MPIGTKETAGLPPAGRSEAIAIYHLSIKIVSRNKGKSAVAAAAYRAGEKITNEYDGVIHDYTRKRGVNHAEILLPDNAPPEYSDRTTLWNAVEKIEKNKNSQLAREIEIALPKELNSEQQIELARDYCRKFFVSAGMCADLCVHDKKDGNPHAHILLTIRSFEPDGGWAAKSRKEYLLDDNGEKILLKSGEWKSRKVDTTDWNNRDNTEIWRQGWADLCNQYLEQNNHTERIDHRSYERQGIDQIPTVHLGVAASAMEKRGIKTEQGNINREIEVTNKTLRQLKARITKLQNWLKEETENTETPTLADYIGDILSRRVQAGKSERSQSVYNLKDASNMLNFLQDNQIMDMAGLDKKFKSMIGKQSDIRDKLKPIERRLHSGEKIHHRPFERVWQNPIQHMEKGV